MYISMTLHVWMGTYPGNLGRLSCFLDFLLWQLFYFHVHGIFMQHWIKLVMGNFFRVTSLRDWVMKKKIIRNLTQMKSPPLRILVGTETTDWIIFGSLINEVCFFLCWWQKKLTPPENLVSDGCWTLGFFWVRRPLHEIVCFYFLKQLGITPAVCMPCIFQSCLSLHLIFWRLTFNLTSYTGRY